MTNGDKIRQLDNKGLANLIYNFIITNKDTTVFKYNDFESNLDNRLRGVNYLFDIINREVCY